MRPPDPHRQNLSVSARTQRPLSPPCLFDSIRSCSFACFFSPLSVVPAIPVVPGETEQPPRAAVADRDGEDAGLLRGGRAAKEDQGGHLQGQLLRGLQPPRLPGAQRPPQVSVVRSLPGLRPPLPPSVSPSPLIFR